MHLKSQHQQLSVHTNDLKLNPKYIAYVAKLLFLLSLWHTFTLKNNIFYTISSGSLVGYFWGKCPILWDDDVDLLMRNKDWVHMEAMWSSNHDRPIRIWDDNWQFKLVTIHNIELQLLRCTFNQDWFKLRLNEPFYENQIDIGGIDLGRIVMYEGYHRGSFDPDVDFYAGPTDNDLPSDFPIVPYGPIETRAVKPSIGENWLDRCYTRQWRMKKHLTLWASDL
ncbi:LicD family protein [Pseudomonadota bacterium]